jgi:hypothetical protein
MIEGYRTCEKTPMMTFGETYTGTFEITEESRKALDELLRQTDEDAVHFFDVFEHDLGCCMFNLCNHCHLFGKSGCRSILFENVHRMIDNQKRMMIQFNKQRQEKQ